MKASLEQLSGSPAKVTFDQPIEGNPKKTREAKLEREKLEEPEFAELCIGNDQVPAEYGLLGWTIEGKTVFQTLRKKKQFLFLVVKVQARATL